MNPTGELLFEKLEELHGAASLHQPRGPADRETVGSAGEQRLGRKVRRNVEHVHGRKIGG
jgi:hypothetical protein